MKLEPQGEKLVLHAEVKRHLEVCSNWSLELVQIISELTKVDDLTRAHAKEQSKKMRALVKQLKRRMNLAIQDD